MARGFSGYFERLEIIRAFAYLHLIGERRGTQFTHARPLHNQISPSGRVERNDAAPMGGAARPSRAHAPMGGQNLYAHRPRAAYLASMAFLAGHHQVSLARHHAMLSVLPAQASLSSTVTFARGPREPCGERSWSR